eukprot:2691938-Prymnesium_polylepis.1
MTTPLHVCSNYWISLFNFCSHFLMPVGLGAGAPTGEAWGRLAPLRLGPCGARAPGLPPRAGER